jgi:hypothetical protein
MLEPHGPDHLIDGLLPFLTGRHRTWRIRPGRPAQEIVIQIDRFFCLAHLPVLVNGSYMLQISKNRILIDRLANGLSAKTVTIQNPFKVEGRHIRRNRPVFCKKSLTRSIVTISDVTYFNRSTIQWIFTISFHLKGRAKHGSETVPLNGRMKFSYGYLMLPFVSTLFTEQGLRDVACRKI